MPWVAFLYAQSELARANQAIETIKSKYLITNKLLNELRNDVIIGGTQLRDFLLEPDPGAANLHRGELTQTRAHAKGLLAAKELQEGGVVYASFVAAYDEYWKTIEPVLEWDAQKRKVAGYPFLRDEVFARRSAMLGMAVGIPADRFPAEAPAAFPAEAPAAFPGDFPRTAPGLRRSATAPFADLCFQVGVAPIWRG